MGVDRPLADLRGRYLGSRLSRTLRAADDHNTDRGRGEMAFGVLQAGLDIEYSRCSIGFTWEGFDEMDKVPGEGSAERLDDGSIEIEFEYRNGDEALLKAKRDPSSTAC
jgi:hypothetical protein